MRLRAKPKIAGMHSARDLSAAPRADVIVVGAGVIGASIAQQVARRGAKVVVLDQAPAIGGGCSYANAGIVAPHHVGPLATPALLREASRQILRRHPAVRVSPARGLAPWLARLLASAAPRRASIAQARLRDLALLSTHLHGELARQGLNPTYRRTGALDIYLRRVARWRSTGLLTPQAVHALEPALDMVAGGRHSTEEWIVESRSFVDVLLDDARGHGADVSFAECVHRILRTNGRLVGVETSTGRIRADHVVVAAGLDSRRLAAQVDVDLPLRGGRGYGIDVSTDESAPRMPIRLKEYRIVITPLPDRIRVCGSMEFGAETRPFKPARAEALLRIAARAIPMLRTQQVLDRWAGERPCTSDGLPVIGTSRAVDGLLVATGHGMWGMILAPVTAQLIAGRIFDDIPEQVDDTLSPDRFIRGGGRSRTVATNSWSPVRHT